MLSVSQLLAFLLINLSHESPPQLFTLTSTTRSAAKTVLQEGSLLDALAVQHQGDVTVQARKVEPVFPDLTGVVAALLVGTPSAFSNRVGLTPILILIDQRNIWRFKCDHCGLGISSCHFSQIWPVARFFGSRRLLRLSSITIIDCAVIGTHRSLKWVAP
jgi:hypothetical protein